MLNHLSYFLRFGINLGDGIVDFTDVGGLIWHATGHPIGSGQESMFQVVDAHGGGFPITDPADVTRHLKSVGVRDLDCGIHFGGG